MKKEYNISHVGNKFDEWMIFVDFPDSDKRSIHLGTLKGKENAELFVKALEEKDESKEK